MQTFRTCLCALLICLVSLAPCYAQELFIPDDETSTLLDEFIRERREIPVVDKPKLSITGDVRFEYDRYHQKVDDLLLEDIDFGEDVRPIEFFLLQFFPNDAFFIEFNLLMDYRTDCTWASVRVEFQDELGKIGGAFDGLDLERALIGYTVWSRGCTRWYVEIGRQPLFERFDSQVQFGSFLDGVFSNISTYLPRYGDFFIQGAFMIVDASVDRWAWIASVGFTDWRKTGGYFKVSYVDWTHGGLRNAEPFTREVIRDGQIVTITVPNPLDPRRWRFRTYQVLLGRVFVDAWRGKSIDLYAAFLYNIDARRDPITDNTLANIAWYVGLQYGQVIKCGDWAAKIIYYHVEAQSILESDNNGIGRGQTGVSIFDALGITNDPRLFARGRTNYKGPSFEWALAITDDISIRLLYQLATPVNRRIGGEVRFQRFMTRVIYVF